MCYLGSHVTNVIYMYKYSNLCFAHWETITFHFRIAFNYTSQE